MKSMTHTSKRRKTTAVRHNLSVLGGYTLAAKRNLGHASANSLVLHLEAKVKDKPVYKWEKLLGASIISGARDWYAAHYRYLETVHSHLRAGDAARQPKVPQSIHSNVNINQRQR